MSEGVVVGAITSGVTDKSGATMVLSRSLTLFKDNLDFLARLVDVGRAGVGGVGASGVGVGGVGVGRAGVGGVDVGGVDVSDGDVSEV